VGISAEEVGRALDGWLGRQRWYAGKSRAGTVRARRLATLADRPHLVQIWIAEITYEHGDVEHYQVPLVLRPEPARHLDHAHVGTVVADDASAVHLYDALGDPEAAGVWIDALARRAVTDGVRFDRRTTVPLPTPTRPGDVQGRMLTAEQSNTSVVYGEAVILKVFRRIEPGTNPDIEVHAALTDLGCDRVAALVGDVSAMIDGEPWSLAMAQEFIAGATDGWRLATASVCGQLVDGVPAADGRRGDFVAEARRLGRSTALVHADLARAFGTTTLSPRDVRERVRRMQARLDAAVREVPELRPVAAGIDRTYRRLATGRDDVPAQRVHGDLHLGQVLRTSRGWILLDFEGEPAKTVGDRRAMDSPLRDVAGMLRSFDYAAHHRLSEAQATPDDEARAQEWSRRNREAYCAGYAEGTGADPRELGLVLDALEADKAVYETVYEARNRPGWLPIPLASLRRLIT